MIAILDYGVGNLFSLKSSLDAIGELAFVSGDENEIRKADRVILPGVGAFEDAAAKLKKSGLADLLIKLAEEGKPIMGICLGMQLLFERSFEYGEHEGLGLIKGEVRPIRDVVKGEYKIPHMGWNKLRFTQNKSSLFKHINDGDYVYFVHSYFADKCSGDTVAVTEYGAPLTAAVQHGNVMGCQFHPEKSGDVGLKILKAFCEI